MLDVFDLYEETQRFIRSQQIINHKARYDVLAFIGRFRATAAPDPDNAIVRVFTCGYCLYFAHMLQFAMSRGHVVLAAPFNHIVWIDDDGIAYDINGIQTDFLFPIPIGALSDGIHDFMHVHAKIGALCKEDYIRLYQEYAPNADLYNKAVHHLETVDQNMI